MPQHEKTVAIYARVSTKDRQETENQLLQLREYCQKQGWMVFKEYIDRETGQTGDRPQFKKLFLHAHQRKFDVVLFWALDRFSREGVRETLNHLSQLEDADVDFVSYTEPYLNTLGHFRDAIIGILASLAKQEVVRRSERVKAGMARAKAEGKRVSRPALPKEKQDQIKKLAAQGIPKKEIARRIGVDPKTVRNYS
ncbi:MAG: recombinase family protein [Pseudomonadota bacterium]|nr:recombinase family protein [Pseudomonadota bacterium]